MKQKTEKKHVRIKLPNIVIPEGVSVDISNFLVKVNGPKGSSEREFINPRLKMEKQENKISIKPIGKKVNKKDKMHLNSTAAHIKNMLFGVKEGYECQVKICSGHFPITTIIEGRDIVIKNFLGEKVPRRVKLFDNINVKLTGDIITLTGNNKERLGLMGATLEKLTNVGKRDKTRFQDGCFIIKKPGEQ
ncbi:MAG: 50S ribosomal protein L6 [Candidatus Nanoarchaeia archaeon]